MRYGAASTREFNQVAGRPDKHADMLKLIVKSIFPRDDATRPFSKQSLRIGRGSPRTACLVSLQSWRSRSGADTFTMIDGKSQDRVIDAGIATEVGSPPKSHSDRSPSFRGLAKMKCRTPAKLTASFGPLTLMTMRPQREPRHRGASMAGFREPVGRGRGCVRRPGVRRHNPPGAWRNCDTAKSKEND
jgi:hypothetical protein